MNFPRSIFSVGLIVLLFSSCGETKEGTTVDNSGNVDSNGSETQLPALPNSQNIEPKTFEVIDSLGKSHGWGYDLYIDGKRTIHQPIIPSLPGNNSFQSEADAKKMGQLAADRMKSTGTFPTILPKDIDSLGIAVSKEIRHFLDSINHPQSIK